ncbi:MAG: hypothetical protein PWQ78_337 [Petrotoga sp.]|nr:hypothetical protein [Petrotoga sp.]
MRSQGRGRHLWELTGWNTLLVANKRKMKEGRLNDGK